MFNENLRIAKDIIVSHRHNIPYKMNLVITKRCNSNCKNCNVWKTRQDEKELSSKEIYTTFGNLPENLFWLAITGGEPFCRKDTTKIITNIAKKNKSLKLISIASNGLKQKEILDYANKIKWFQNIKFFITISVDGPRDIHDKIRGKEGFFDKTMNTYKKLKKTLKNKKI